MKINLFAIVLSVFFLSSISLGQVVTEYEFKWEVGKLPFDVKTVALPLTQRARVSENGPLTDKVYLPVQPSVIDGKLSMRSGEQAILAILIRNNGKKKIRFSVAPHATHPGISALGFSFNCLCNGHVYEVLPGAAWYRIMRLQSRASESEPKVVLTHQIFEVKK
jgi:hypothetical protein